MAKDEVIAINKLFTKGFVRDEGTNKIPEHFADTAINVRLVNWGITIRNWHKEIYSSTWTSTPQWITANESRQLLYFVYSWTVYSINTTTWTATSLGSISSTEKCRFIHYWKYTIFLTWDQRPYYIDWTHTITFDANLVTGNAIDLDLNGVSMTTVNFNTDNNTTLDDLATQIETDFTTEVESAVRSWTDKVIITLKKWQVATITNAAVTGWASQANITDSQVYQTTTSEVANWVNPSFGGTFAWFTIINRNDTENVISVSNPIDLNTQGNSKDWEWWAAYTISLKGDVEGMCATLSRFWIFTDKSIEYISNGFLDSSWSYVPTTFGDWEPLASPDCVVPAGDLVFFVTKSKKIRSIGYAWTITEPQIKTISDIEWSWIQSFMQDSLAEDQSLAFGHYDRLNNLIKFHFVWVNSNVPDTILCRDIEANQWLLDLDKSYSSICTFGINQYAAAAIWQSVFQDEVGEDDDWNAIDWEYTTQNMGLSEPSLVKFWRGMTIAWQITYETLIRTQIFIDDTLAFDKYIDWSIENPFVGSWVGATAVWDEAVGDVSEVESLVDFEKVVSLWRFRTKGKKIRISFSGGNIWQKMVLDFLSLTYRKVNRRRRKDKKFTSV